MPWPSLGLGGQRQHVGGYAGTLGGVALAVACAQPSPAVQRLGPGVLAGGRMSQRLGRVPHRRAAPVGDHVGHLGGAVPAVAAVHVLDHLLAPVALDVDVYVGRPVSLGRQEPLEQQPQRHRVHVGDAQHVAHRRVGGRPPALAVDVAAAAERGDVPHHQEVARKPELLDHVELVADLAPGARHPLGLGRAVAGPGALDGETAQEGGLVEAVGARVRRQLRRHQRQAEGALRPEPGRGLGRSGVAGEAAGLLGAGAQVGASPGGQPAVVFVEAAPVADRGEGIGQAAVAGHGVAHRVGAHRLHSAAHAQLGQSIVAVAVERVAMVPQLHEHVAGAGRADQPVELGGRRSGAVLHQRRGHRTAVCAGEDRPPVALGGCRLQECLARQSGLALAAGHVRPADQRAQCRVPGRVAGQHHHRAAPVAPLGRRGGAGPAGRAGQVEGEFRAEHRGQAGLLGGLGEPHHPVEAVPVGERQSVETEPDRLGHQLLRVRGAVHEAEPRVRVQLRIRHLGKSGALAGLAAGETADHAGPAGGSAAAPAAPVRPLRCARPVRQAALQFPPGNDRIVEPHREALSRRWPRATSGRTPARTGGPIRRRGPAGSGPGGGGRTDATSARPVATDRPRQSPPDCGPPSP